MTVNRSRRALELFEQAMCCPQDQVSAFLDEACDNTVLRDDVESLLASSPEASGFLSISKTRVRPHRSTSVSTATMDNEPRRLRPDTVLMDRYVVRESIGSGGIGVVYRARDTRLERDVAIKVLNERVTDQKTRDRFEREMRSAAALSHPNAMSLHDIGDHDGVAFAVMELVDGRVLREVMTTQLPVAQAIAIATGIADGLAAAHQRNLMHRDIKPENIMVSADGHVKVLDFGLAKQLYASTDQNITHTAMIQGTIPYMSPEQAEGNQLSCKTDVFSLGIVLLEMLTGTNPFRGDTILETLRRVTSAKPPRVSEFRTDIPSGLDALVAEALSHSADDRPPARQLAARLRGIGRQLSGTAVAEVNRFDDRSNSDSTNVAPVSHDTGIASLNETSIIPRTTKYARCGDVHIAYQVFGDGPLNLVIAPGFISNIDNYWASTAVTRWLLGFSRFARVAIFDKRGTGLSDRVSHLPNMDERMEDVCTVMDAAGFESAAILGISEGGCLASLFAASHPDRCQALILHGAFAHFDSWFESDDALEEFFEYIRSAWGSGTSLPYFAPSMADDAELRDWWGKFERLGANPGAAIDLMRMNSQIDISGALPAIQAPTLVIHRENDSLIDPHASHELAAKIPDAQLVTSPGSDHLPFVSDAVGAEIDAVRDFLHELPDLDTRERALATVLAVQVNQCSDDSSPLDHEAFNATIESIERKIGLHRGSQMTRFRNLYIATFDGPARAIRCAKSIASSSTKVKVGLHTGEVAVGDNTVEGVAVDVATSFASLSNEGQVIVSRVVRDLAAGCGLKFSNLGDYQLDGDVNSWELFRVL